MRIVLWDTRHGGTSKDFAGGFGVGRIQGVGLRGRLVEMFYRRDYRPPPLAYGILAQALKAAGHQVQYSLEGAPAADVYIFNPALMTLARELDAMAAIHARFPRAALLVCGQVANTLPECFRELPCTVVRGEPEQIGPRLDELLSAGGRLHDLGAVKDLNALPFPDWSIFPYRRFRVAYEFWKFPTAYVQSSRGCTLSCTYCPYIIAENKVRTRAPALVAEEIQRNIVDFGFRSFKFRDPLFGARRGHLLEIAERLARLPRRIQFSVESRIELLPRDALIALRAAGLTSVTVGIETPSHETLRRYKRALIKDDKQRHFVDLCRELGIRVVAGFMIGFPEDTRATMRAVLRYAKAVNPFAANFNVCTPYPGTPFFKQVEAQIASRDWSRFDVYTPNLTYENLSPHEVAQFHHKCIRQFYGRWQYLAANWRFLLPRLHAAWCAVRTLTRAAGPRGASAEELRNCA